MTRTEFSVPLPPLKLHPFAARLPAVSHVGGGVGPRRGGGYGGGAGGGWEEGEKFALPPPPVNPPPFRGGFPGGAAGGGGGPGFCFFPPCILGMAAMGAALRVGFVVPAA